MSDQMSDGLRREYEAGHISADSYIIAGGDPDVVRDVELWKAAMPEPKGKVALRAVVVLVAAFLILLGAVQVTSFANPAIALVLGVAGLMLIVVASKI